MHQSVHFDSMLKHSPRSYIERIKHIMRGRMYYPVSCQEMERDIPQSIQTTYYIKVTSDDEVKVLLNECT